MSRIIFITGATSGIGKACAEKFAANGDNLIINGRRKQRLEELKLHLVKNFKVDVLCAAFDVQKKEDVFESIKNIPENWKAVDLLLNNAGLALGRDLFDKADIQDWETMINTNVKGLLYVSKAIIPEMIQRNNGHIINISSISGDEVYEGGNVYCATKSAVDFISRAMRIDMLSHHIKVTNIKPGAAETEFSVVRFKGDEEKAKKVYDGMMPLTPEDIADTIFYCASLPPNVCINELTVTCTAQANGIYSYRKG
jgi:NADP-dependent 3-hydroxy acid dehydrogenase YdfG